MSTCHTTPPEPPSASTALASPDTLSLALDRGREALLEARDDFQRLQIRDQAAAAVAAASILKRRDIVASAQWLVLRAERAIAEANPAQANTGRARKRTVTSSVTVPKKQLSEMRTAASALTNAEFDVAEAASVANPEASPAPTRTQLVAKVRRTDKPKAPTLLVAEVRRPNQSKAQDSITRSELAHILRESPDTALTALKTRLEGLVRFVGHRVPMQPPAPRLIDEDEQELEDLRAEVRLLREGRDLDGDTERVFRHLREENANLKASVNTWMRTASELEAEAVRLRSS